MNNNSLRIERYAPELESIWNNFVDKSSNGSFLLKRSFMDYHQDRFEDFSYLIWKGKEIIAAFVGAMPRQRSNDYVIIAHPGLTYGGVITIENLKYSLLEEIYQSLLGLFKQNGFNYLIIKPVPRVFCKKQSDANLFFFHKNNFRLLGRELNSVIDLNQPLRISKGRKDNIRKAKNSGVLVEDEENFTSFWQILTENLQQTHSVKPVHTLQEIQVLYHNNPDNIKLYIARLQERIIAGVVIFRDHSQGYLHTQYISANEEGKSVGAVDAILIHIIQEAQSEYQRFSFGISTAKGEINYGLLGHKEGFGADVELLDTYEKELL